MIQRNKLRQHLDQRLNHLQASQWNNDIWMKKKSRSEIVLLNNLPQSLLITVSITLVNSDVPSRGRIQLWYKGEKGSICDDDFDEKDATVVCQMFGYRYGY